MDDRGGAAALRVRLLAGKRGRLLAGRLAWIPEPALAGRRKVALRHMEAPPLLSGLCSPGRALPRTLSVCALDGGAAGLLDTDGRPPAAFLLSAGRPRAENEEKEK